MKENNMYMIFRYIFICVNNTFERRYDSFMLGLFRHVDEGIFVHRLSKALHLPHLTRSYI